MSSNSFKMPTPKKANFVIKGSIYLVFAFLKHGGQFCNTTFSVTTSNTNKKKNLCTLKTATMVHKA